jgi:hypothetical protein
MSTLTFNPGPYASEEYLSDSLENITYHTNYIKSILCSLFEVLEFPDFYSINSRFQLFPDIKIQEL